MHFFNNDTVIEPSLDHGGNAQDGKGTTVYDKEMSSGDKNSQKVVTREFLKKYISFAKSQNDPELSDDAMSLCSVYYAGLRTKAFGYNQDKVSVPVTVRTLETMIRLSTAHAKLRQSKVVDNDDVDIAFKMISKSIFSDMAESEVVVEDQEMEEEESEEIMPVHKSRARNNKRERTPTADLPEE